MASRREAHKKRHEAGKKYVHPKLRRSLRIYFVISLIVLILVICDMLRDHANPFLVLLGLIVGILVGNVFTRIYKITWDDEGGNVIQRMDIFGIVLIIFYIAFDLSREHLVEIFVHGGSVASISLALLAGALYGRVLGSIKVIKRVIRDEKIFSLNDWIRLAFDAVVILEVA